MTEAEWLASDDPARMLKWLLGKRGPGASDRKLRLLMCCYLRGLWPHLDGQNRPLIGWQEDHPETPPRGKHLRAGWSRPLGSPREFVSQVQGVSCVDGWASRDRGIPRDVQAALLREVVGDPFRPASFEDAWRTSAVASLAQAAYDERLTPSFDLDPVRLSILADALEDGGCAVELLAHLRSPGPHVRGCWALDLVLGKQ
jgi:hypothetical protein